MLGMTDTPMFPGFTYDPLDDQIPTGAEDDLLLWLGENQETDLTVELSVENIPPATAHWFDSIWDDQGWLVSENIDAIMNLIILKAHKWPETFNKWWTTVDLTFWAKMTNAVYVNWKKADKRNDWAWLDEENVVIDYILGKLPLHGTGRAWLFVDKVFGVGHVTNNHWVLYKMCVSTQVITVYDSLGGDGGRGNPRYLSPVRKLASLMRGICKDLLKSHKGLGSAGWKKPWVVQLCTHAPQQLDGSSCGILCMKMFECLISDTNIRDINPERCSQFRKKYRVEMFDGKNIKKGR
ncbi:hypothetical protein ACS0TY_007680 [Phlomoides rotata]